MADLPDLHDLIVSSRVRRLAGDERPDGDPTLERIRRGYFRPRDAVLTVEDEHRLRIASTADARSSGLAFSHASAATLWGAPMLKIDLTEVHAVQPGRPRRTTAGVRVHATVVPEEHLVTLPSGLLVTSREWTAVQVAAALPLPNVLLPLDHLLRSLVDERGGDQQAITDALVDMIPGRMRGRARAERHLRLADMRSGSAGESLSRGQMVLLEVPMPDLQVHFPRADGMGDDVVDFDWPEQDAFGEFDGKGKYFRKEFQNRRSPEEVLWEEKVREDRVRRQRPRAARWGWDVAMSRQRLAAVLAAAGVRRRR